MKVGDLVRVRIAPTLTLSATSAASEGVGFLVERSASHWWVFVEGEQLAFHESYLKPLDIVREKK